MIYPPNVERRTGFDGDAGNKNKIRQIHESVDSSNIPVIIARLTTYMDFLLKKRSIAGHKK